MDINEELEEKRSLKNNFLKLPNSLEREYHLTILDLEILKLEFSLKQQILITTIDLLRDYKSKGIMQITLNGDILQGNITGNDYEEIKKEAQYLAGIAHRTREL